MDKLHNSPQESILRGYKSSIPLCGVSTSKWGKSSQRVYLSLIEHARPQGCYSSAGERESNVDKVNSKYPETVLMRYSSFITLFGASVSK